MTDQLSFIVLASLASLIACGLLAAAGFPLLAGRREVFGRRKDETEFPAEASISKLDVEGEKVFTVILRDITERKRAEEVIRASQARKAAGRLAALRASSGKAVFSRSFWRIDKKMGARILVIEDNPANLELMSYLLRAFGHEVLTACDGEAGLEAVRREAPDLIVCDIQIPKIHGLEVARQLKRHPSMGKIPLVAVTAFAMVGDRDKVLSAGFDGYVAKPIVPDKFVQQVEAFLPSFEPVTVEPAAPTTAAVPLSQDRRATILVVDDSYVNTELARCILEPVGYEVIVAGSVAEALELVGEIDPDLILSDVHMREATGFDLLRSLKADLVFSRIPVVFISSTVWQEADRVKGLEMGAAKFILRPADPEVVLAEIEQCLVKPR